MKLTSTGIKRNFPLFCCILIIFSCTRMDAEFERKALQKDFFGLPANAKAPLNRIANELKRQDELTGFLKNIANNDGIPRWDKAIIDTRSTKNKYFSNRFDGGFEADTLVMLPLVLEDTNYVNAFIMARVNDSVILDLYRLNDYDLFPYGDPDADTLTAERLTLTFLFLDRQVFGPRKYRIIDDSLFRPRPGMSKEPGELKRTLEYTNKDSALYPGRLLAVVCTTTSNCWCFRPGNSCDGDHRCMNGNCDNCYLCIDVNCTTVSIPSGPGGWPPGGSSGGGGTGGSGGGGSGFPSGGSGNCTGSTCYSGTMLLMGRLPCGGCGDPPIIIPPINDTLPCNPFMTQLEHDATFKANFATLKTSTTLGLVYEKGFLVRRSDNLYVPKSGDDNQQSINWNVNGPIDGLLHSHYADLNSIFSMGDVVFMAQVYLAGLAHDSTNLFFGVTSSYGPPMMIKVGNTAAFRTFAMKIAGATGNDLKKQEKFINKYQRRFDSNNPNTNEIDFLKMLKEENALNAITLYRGSYDLDKWTELTIDNLSNVSSVPCIYSVE